MNKKSNTTYYVIGALVVLAIVLLGYNNFSTWFQPDAADNGAGGERVPCINPALPIPPQYHIHPQLKLVIDGKETPVPANIGLSVVGCERAIHTHDVSGEIHIEPNYYQAFTLGDFFSVWQQPFDQTHILNKAADADHQVIMTVDGQPNTEFGNLILKDKQQIVIEYKKT